MVFTDKIKNYYENLQSEINSQKLVIEDMLIKDINEKVQEQIEPNYKHVRIVKAQLRNKAGMLGAAYLASERLKNWKK